MAHANTAAAKNLSQLPNGTFCGVLMSFSQRRCSYPGLSVGTDTKQLTLLCAVSYSKTFFRVIFVGPDPSVRITWPLPLLESTFAQRPEQSNDSGASVRFCDVNDVGIATQRAYDKSLHLVARAQANGP